MFSKEVNKNTLRLQGPEGRRARLGRRLLPPGVRRLLPRVLGDRPRAAAHDLFAGKRGAGPAVRALGALLRRGGGAPPGGAAGLRTLRASLRDAGTPTSPRLRAPSPASPRRSRSVFPGDSGGAFQSPRALGTPRGFLPPPACSPWGPRKSRAPHGWCAAEPARSWGGRGDPAGSDEAVLAAVSQSHRRRGPRRVPARVLSRARSRPGPPGVRGPRPAGRSRGPGLPGAVLGRRRVQDPLRGLGDRPREVLGQSRGADQLVQALDQDAGEQTFAFHQLVSDFAPTPISFGRPGSTSSASEPGVLLGKEDETGGVITPFKSVFNFNFISQALLLCLEGFVYLG